MGVMRVRRIVKAVRRVTEAAEAAPDHAAARAIGTVGAAAADFRRGTLDGDAFERVVRRIIAGLADADAYERDRDRANGGAVDTVARKISGKVGA